MKTMKITGLEANFLLYCLDAFCDVNMKGKLTKASFGYSLEALQDLRDRMMAIHEHPEEIEEGEGI